jgi:hypothetical protein
MLRTKPTALLLAASAALGAAALPGSSSAGSRADDQTTTLISKSMDGGLPNGPSTNAVISNDKRFARDIAFESDASNLVPGDSNGVKDVFVVARSGSVKNDGADWKPGKTSLISRGANGAAADGPSFSPSIDGGFHYKPSCVGFLSDASNLVSGDTNGTTDAFVAKIKGGPVKRVSLPGGSQSSDDTTGIAVSGNCKLIAFVTGGKIYVSKNGKKAKQLKADSAADPSFSTGLRTDLVFGASGGIYLSANGTGKPKLVAPGGRNPAYNDIKRRVVAYEKTVGGRTQIGYRDVGKPEKIISAHKGSEGNGSSKAPVIGNAGYYVTFQSEASNLGVNALGRTGDSNGRPDAYLYTNVRNITLVQSVEKKAEPLPGGGENPSMSFYANYIVFDSPGPLGASNGTHQIYMRYLGPL